MKRIISLLTFVACFALSQAATITQSQAMERAQQFFAKNSPMRVGSITRPSSPQVQLAHTAVSKVGSVDFYVFNHASDAGYVIVSADDQLVPVLGYADSGSFSAQDIPDGLQYWLDEYQRQIEYLHQHPEQVRAAQTQATEVKPLLSCNWNQSAPYNNNCPIYSGSTRCVTGCVATATAQIMYYHKWPLKGTGSHSYTSSSQGYNLSANFGNSTYDWANMVDNYGSSNTSVQNAAVARLMSDVGISVDMDYGQSSGAVSADVATALPTYFGYDKSIVYLDRDAYGIETWEAMIRNEHNAGRPVFYKGRSDEGGHAFVCDGYDTEGYFHFNWGWGGMSNGYFILSILNPGEQGIGSFEGGYNTGQAIIINIKPDEGGTATEVPTSASCNITPNVSYVNLGSQATFYIDNISVNGLSWNKLYWGICATTANSNATIDDVVDGPTSLVDASAISCGNSYRVSSQSYTPSSSLAEGKYYVRYMLYKDEVPYMLFGGTGKYLAEMEVKNGKAYFSEYKPEVHIVANNFVLSSNPVYKDQSFTMSVDVVNEGDEYFDNVYIAFVNPTGTIASTSDAFKVAIAPGKSFTLKTTHSANVAVGEYSLAILNASKEVIGSTPITVADGGGSSNLQLVTDVTPAASEMPAKDVRATAVIKNTGGVFSGTLKLYILYSGSGGYYISNTLYSDVITLKQNESATLNFKGEFAGSVGSTYYLGLQNPASTSAQLWSSIVPFTVCEDKPSIVGDVNGDGDVDIADINSVVSIILQQKQASDFVGNADLNNDGDVDIADINTIVSIILNK